MIVVNDKGNSIQLFGSIKELPIARYKVLQTILLQDSGIGADMAAIDQRLERILMFANAEKPQETREEVLNLRYTFYSLLKGLDYKTRAFACLISEINGVKQTDLSDEGLKNTVKVLEDLDISFEQVESWWDDVKKKLIPN